MNEQEDCSLYTLSDFIERHEGFVAIFLFFIMIPSMFLFWAFVWNFFITCS